MNSNITVGNYKNTSYTFIAGTRVVSVLGLDIALDISKIKLFANQTQNKLYGAKSFWSGNTIQQNVCTGTPTIGTATSGGNVDVGAHQYKVTFVYSSGEESLAGAASSVITISGSNRTVPLTNIPTGNSSVVARNIYRTLAGGSVYYYVGQVADNTTTTYTDILVDSTASANQVEPTISSAYDIVLANSFSTLATGDILDIEIELPNSNEDDDLGVTKNINLDSSELPPADTEVSTITDTNLSIGKYFYELPQSSWRTCINQLKATCSTASSLIRILRTLDPAAAVPATNGTPSVDWDDCTFDIYGVTQIIVPTTGTLILPIRNYGIEQGGGTMMNDRYLIEYDVKNATNFLNINSRKI